MSQQIKFLRSSTIYEKRVTAVNALSTLPHLSGQPVVAFYENNDALRALFAVGIEEGSGTDKYTILADIEDVEILAQILSTHEAKLAGATAGHALTGNDLTFISGKGIINPNVITLNKLQQATGVGIIGSITGSGNLTMLTPAQLGAMLNVANGAEVNQLAYSTVKVTDKQTTPVTTTIAAAAKTDTIEFVEGSNITLTPDVSGKKITISASGSTSFTLVPKDGSQPIQVAGDINAVETSIINDINLPGVPTTTTAPTSDNSTKIATTAFTKTAITTALAVEETVDEVDYDSAGNVLTITYRDGSAKDINLLMDSFLVFACYAVSVADFDVKWEDRFGEEVESPTAIITESSLVFVVKTEPSEEYEAIIIPVTNLINEYTAGNGIDITNNVISIEEGGVIKEMLDESFLEVIDGKTDKTITVTAGPGLTGGGNLSANRTINHGAKPAGTVATDKDYVSGITIDTYGHIASVTKGTLSVGSDERVKTTSGDTADYLETKFVTKTGLTGNEFAVSFSTVSNKIAGSVSIDIIDGGTF